MFSPIYFFALECTSMKTNLRSVQVVLLKNLNLYRGKGR